MSAAAPVSRLPITYRSKTFVFTDIVSSTEKLTLLGEETWLRALQSHNAVVQSEVSRFGGDVSKFLGDGWMVTFDDPADAVCAAEAIQDAVASDGSDFQIRVGVHCGRVVDVGGDYVGKDVVLASRITREAGPGEIVVSADVVDLLDEVDFDGGRIAHLKGLGPHLVFGLERTVVTTA